jgi:hypothetical protein
VVVASLATIGLLLKLTLKEVGDSVVCSEQIVADMAVAIKDADLTKQAEGVAKIQSQKNYEQDINCNYIITRYGISVDDIELADAALNNMKRLYAKGERYSSEFNHPVLTLDDLTLLVQGLKSGESAGFSMGVPDGELSAIDAAMREEQSAEGGE